MADERVILSSINFVYEYTGHGWALASISNGVDSYTTVPSYVPTDPLFELLRALVQVLRYGSDADCEWFYEPAADRWALHREGDRLRIVIRRVRSGGADHNWPFEAGELKFASTCEIWKFAAKVRLSVSRMTPVEEKYLDPTSVQRTVEYRALCNFIEEQKRLHPSTSDNRK